MKQKGTTILAIETSCDDTCISIIKASAKTKPNFGILSNIVSSQIEIHKKWGGIYPTLAKREHQRNLLPVLTKALKQSKLLKIPNSQFLISNKNLKQPSGESLASLNPAKYQKIEKILEREGCLYKELEKFLRKYRKPDVDLIAITSGPGLEPCLWVGINFARALAYYWNLPIITVNHIEAHILVNETNKKSLAKKDFPAVCLIVSGGNTQLFLMKNFGKYKILGETRDDAAGECFDKTARILGLGYPGGPAIAREAQKLQTTNYKLQTKLPRPMIKQKNYDFSFSGLKTAVLYKVKGERLKVKDEKYIQNMCWEIQQAIIDVLVAKTIRAAKQYKAKTVIIGGGVAANKELRKQLREAIKKQLPNTYYLLEIKKDEEKGFWSARVIFDI